MSTASVPTSLELDAAIEIDRITQALRSQLSGVLKRRGLVVAMSGGVDSSVCAALAVRAVGPDRVLGLSLPERESDDLSLRLAQRWAGRLGIEHHIQHIGPTLEALGCYRERDAAIRRVVPEFDAAEGWRSKLVLPVDRLRTDRLNVTSLEVRSPEGVATTVRLPPAEYRQIVAATNFKQRVRTMVAYYHADRMHYAVVGTPNRLEYDQGFFVKGGDGLADVKPIAHLYKTQVYQLAAALGVPDEICGRTPTTETFSLPQTQEEFYFALPVRLLDVVLQARTAGRPVTAVAEELGMDSEQIARAYLDIDRKRMATAYLHAPPLLVEEIALSAPDPRPEATA